MIRQPIIYGLFDPRNGELRYVGKSANGLARCASHVCPSSLRAVTRKNGWLKSLLKIGLKPEAAELEAVSTVDGLDETERHWIAAMRFIGCRLTNMTDGGDGQVGIKFSEEHRAKLSASQKGKPRPSKRSPESYRLATEKLRGRKRAPEAIAATLANRKTFEHTPESLTRQAASMRAKWQDPTYRARVLAARGIT